MTINLSVPQNETLELKPRINVVGVGGAGGNAVNNMINGQLEGCEFIVANTDAQALIHSGTERRIQLGTQLTQGLGAGSKPEIGRAAAEETIDELNEQLKGAHMVFIAAGMGGGTGTGAAPVIARAARDAGILTVGVVTKPFQFEGSHRMRIAEKGIEELEQYVDTLIIIPNQNLFRVATEKTTFSDAFKMADDVLYSGVRSVTDLMVRPGLINLDFADVRSVMNEMGKAMMGTGEAEGERRALDAAEAAISNPLLDDASMAGANGVLINITGGSDMTLFEVDEAANRIRSEVDSEAYIIFGSTFEEGLEGRIRVSVVATGIDAEHIRRPAPTMLPMSDAIARPQIPGNAEEVAEAPEAEVAEVAEVEFSETAEGVDEQAAGSLEAAAERVMMTAEEVSAAAAEIEMVEDAPQEDEMQIDLVDDLEAAAPSAEAEVSAEPQLEAAPEPMPAPPAAMTSEDAEEAFIPPAPAGAEDDIDGAAADPFAAAAIVNGTPEPIEDKPQLKSNVTRGRSLFDMVTNTARNTFGTAAPETPAQPEATPEPLGEVAQPEPVAQVAPAPTAETTPEPRLGGLDPDERVQASQGEEDLLDIPAFLRRQAN